MDPTTEFPGLNALAVLYERSRACTRCTLAQCRSQVVFGDGNSEEPDIAFVGAAPGEVDDERGLPFTGPNDTLLWTALEHATLARSSLYFVNAVGCKTPEGRPPAEAELEACRPLWQAQLLAVAPKVIVCLGAVATRAVLEEGPWIRGEWYFWREIPVRVSIAPGAMLSNPAAKQWFWDDLRTVKAKLTERKKKP